MRKVALQNDKGTLIPECFIAESYMSRFLGLMGRSSIPQNEAICFPRCNSIHTFFMRFPIDVILVGEDGKIISVVRAMKPWRMLLPRKGVKHVIEMQANRVAALDLQEGVKLICDGVWA
ncbi:MAG: DUF192 domain-containing protein [Bdellovibrionota bacterium]